jgi:NAD(P)H-hydrate repair Nnr-like enzyme with NAD(P)H-hydrate dehydratase domain
LTESEAVAPIKSLSPDLIVIEFDEDLEESRNMALKRIDCLVVGSGLSRRKLQLSQCKYLIGKYPKGKCIIVDGVFFKLTNHRME